MADLAFNDTSFNADNDIRLPYAAAWGADPWDAIATREGVKVGFELQLEDEPNDACGIADKNIQGLDVTISFTPQGITPEQVLTALGVQGTGARRGRGMSALSRTFTLTGDQVGDPIFTFNKMMIDNNVSQFGANANRVGELTLTSLAGMAEEIFAYSFVTE